jgi:hypothetical protein
VAEAIRFDRARITSWERTPEGFLRVHATFGRTGLQRYRNPDGSVRVEYRPEAEVARQDSLDSYGGRPVTLEHPPHLLTPDNTREHSRGSTGTRVNYDTGFVTGTITLTDREAIEAVERRDAVEISPGYRVTYDGIPGVAPNGERFDGTQRNISVNHVAVVRKGRAGSEVCIHMDAADTEDIGMAIDAIDGDDHSPQEHQMGAQRTDGRKQAPAPADAWEEGGEGEESMEEEHEEGTHPAPKAKKRRDAGRCDSETVPMEKYLQVVDERDTAIRERNDALEQLELNEGRAAALIERLDALEAEVSERLDAQPDFDALVQARIQLLDQAEQLTNQRETYDGLSDREVRIDALEKFGVDPDRFDGRSDDYVEAAFESYLSLGDLRGNAADALGQALQVITSPRLDAAPVSIEEAQQRMIERTAAAHQQA